MAGKFLDVPLREVIAKHGLMAKKSLGQHFLLDPNLLRRIASLAGDLREQTVFEIGPGPGGLTRALLETEARRIIAVEKDGRCVAALRELEEISGGRLAVIEADAMKTDLLRLAEGRKCSIVSNLPYNVGTPLTLKWLEEMPAYSGMTLMFQLEVANRLTASVGDKAYGRLAVAAQFCCLVEKVLDVPAAAFTPRPQVDSAVVRLTPRHDKPTDLSLRDIESVTAAAFGQRRKMLRSSLRSLGGEALLNACGISATSRAEELPLSDFETLARAIRAKV